MGLGDALAMTAGIAGGAINSGVRGYQWDEEQKLAKQKLEQAEQFAQLRADVAAMVANIRADASRDVAGTNATSRENVAGQNIASREKIAGQSETGRNLRHSIDNAFSYDKLDQDYELGHMRDATTQRGQDIGSQDRRYGIDTGAATSRYGINTRDATQRRGQNMNFTLGGDRIDATERGQDLAAETARAGQESAASSRKYVADQATQRAKMRPDPFKDIFSPQATPLTTAPAGDAAGAGPTTIYPDGAVTGPGAGGRTPVTPAGVAPAPAPAAAAPAPAPKPAGRTPLSVPKPVAAPTTAPNPQILVQKATQLLQQFQAEKDPTKKQQLAAELAVLRQQIVDAKQGR